MRITDKDTADDVKYHLMAENPPEPPKKASECRDFFTLTDGTCVCRIRPYNSRHCLCENLVKFGECPKGIKEM